MLLAEFLAALTGGLDEVVWVGADGDSSPVGPDVATASEVPSDPTSVPVLPWRDDGPSPAVMTSMQRRPDGSRVVFLADHLLTEVAAEKSGSSFAGANLELVYAVPIDDAGHLDVFTAYATRRVTSEPGEPGNAPPTALVNISVLRAFSACTSGDALRDQLRALARAVADARVEQATLEDELRSRSADLQQAHAELRALRTSAAMQVGRAAVDLVTSPRRGIPALPRRLRAAWRARPVDSHDATTGGSIAGASGGEQSRRLRYSLPLPGRPAPANHSSRPHPTTLEIDVPTSLYVARVLHRDGIGAYEPEVLPWFLGLCDTAGPGAVWDVGANIGLFGLLARAYTDRPVVGFEPTAEVAHWARRIAQANDLPYRIEQLAVGESPGMATFYLSDRTDASNSLAQGFRPSSKSVQVLVESLDRYAKVGGQPPPAILKIDTETTEHLILRGARRLVAEHRPWIVCEVLVAREPARVLTEVMRGSGYTYYQLTEGAELVEHDSITGDPTNKYPNYLLAPARPTPETLAAVRRWSASLSEVRRA